MTSTVWVAGMPLSVLRRNEKVIARLRSGTDVGTNGKLGRLSRDRSDGFGAPETVGPKPS